MTRQANMAAGQNGAQEIGLPQSQHAAPSDPTQAQHRDATLTLARH